MERDNFLKTSFSGKVPSLPSSPFIYITCSHALCSCEQWEPSCLTIFQTEIPSCVVWINSLLRSTTWDEKLNEATWTPCYFSSPRFTRFNLQIGFSRRTDNGDCVWSPLTRKRFGIQRVFRRVCCSEFSAIRSTRHLVGLLASGKWGDRLAHRALPTAYACGLRSPRPVLW